MSQTHTDDRCGTPTLTSSQLTVVSVDQDDVLPLLHLLKTTDTSKATGPDYRLAQDLLRGCAGHLA